MIKKMDSKNIFCFVCTELQNPPEIHASRLEHSFKVFDDCLYKSTSNTKIINIVINNALNFPIILDTYTHIAKSNIFAISWKKSVCCNK